MGRRAHSSNIKAVGPGESLCEACLVRVLELEFCCVGFANDGLWSENRGLRECMC